MTSTDERSVYSHPLGFAPKILHREAMLDQSEPCTITRRWHNMVYEYTNLKLSRPSDRLVAISGLVKKMQCLRKRKYLAGLWEDTLSADLAWSASETRSDGLRMGVIRSGRYDPWQGPTWSWASIIGTVIFQEDWNLAQATPTCKHIEVQSTSTELGDATSQVAEAKLAITGRIVPATVWWLSLARVYAGTTQALTARI